MNNSYVQNKVITFSLLAFLYLAPLLVFTNPHHLFTYYILLYMVTGYCHFILGFFYQTKSIASKNKKTRIHGLLFYILALLLSILFFVLAGPGSPVGFLVISFVNGYFLLHGAFNEALLYKRQTKKQIPRAVYFIPIALFLLYIASLPHFSAFFSYTFDFTFENQQEVFANTSLLLQTFETAFEWGLIVTGAIGLVFLADALRRKDTTGIIILAATSVTTFIALQLANPIPFVTLLSLVLVYHFVTWAVFYFQEFGARKDKQKEFNHYLWLTVLIHAVLIALAVAGLLSSGLVQKIFNLVYFIPFFLSVTFMHITTSFLNEAWYKKFMNIQ